MSQGKRSGLLSVMPLCPMMSGRTLVRPTPGQRELPRIGEGPVCYASPGK
jgi:hypothetical protein